MTATVFVKPREGGRVRMPERNFRVMKAEGETVRRTDFYERLIIGGDVVITEKPPAPPPAPPAADPAVAQVVAQVTAAAATPAAAAPAAQPAPAAEAPKA